MGLLRQNLRISQTGAVPLILNIAEGYSALVRNIVGYPAPTTAVASAHLVQVDRRSILQFVMPAGAGLLWEDCRLPGVSIWQQIVRAGLWEGIPLAAGQTLTITAPGVGNHIEVTYDLYEAGDILPDRPNGSDGKKYQLLQVVSNAAAGVATGEILLNASDLGNEFPRFPGGAEVPSKYRMTLRALFGGGQSEGTGAANNWYTTRFRLIRDREDIITPDFLGCLNEGDAAYAVAAILYQTDFGQLRYPGAVFPARIMPVEPGIVFNAGDELNVLANFTLTTAGPAIGELKLGLLFDVERVE